MIRLGTVLITGGTGTFGRAMTEACLKEDIKTIRILSRGEYEQAKMKEEIKDDRLRFFIGDVRDRNRLWRAFQGVDLVIHAAALKHVSICEYNPIEAVKTNIMGAVNVIEAALDCKVSKVVNISSDKAVHPVSIYGATKLCAEKIFAHASAYGKTKFSSIRFGNFFGSRGSVIETWIKQRQAGKPITVTEKDMSRYWINIDEAIAFTLSCLDRMGGSEVFIPIMPMYNLEELISYVAPECKIEIIGRRKGERKEEMLFNEDEAPYVVKQKDCLIIKYS